MAVVGVAGRPEVCVAIGSLCNGRPVWLMVGTGSLVDVVEDEEDDDDAAAAVVPAAVLISLSAKCVKSVGGTLTIADVGFGFGFGARVVTLTSGNRVAYTFCVVVEGGGDGVVVSTTGAAVLVTSVVLTGRRVVVVVVAGGRRDGGFLYTGFFVDDDVVGRLAAVGLGRCVARDGFLVVVVIFVVVVVVAVGVLASAVVGRCVVGRVACGRRVVLLVVFRVVDVTTAGGDDLRSVVVGNGAAVVVSCIDWNVCSLILSVVDGDGISRMVVNGTSSLN